MDWSMQYQQFMHFYSSLWPDGRGLLNQQFKLLCLSLWPDWMIHHLLESVCYRCMCVFGVFINNLNSMINFYLHDQMGWSTSCWKVHVLSYGCVCVFEGWFTNSLTLLFISLTRWDDPPVVGEWTTQTAWQGGDKDIADVTTSPWYPQGWLLSGEGREKQVQEEKR